MNSLLPPGHDATARRLPARLSLLHRCAVLYLTAPVLVWLAGWFEWWFGLPAALLVGLAVAPALRGTWRPHRPSPATLAIVGLGFAWTMLTAHGGVFDGNNYDWWDRRAILLDLSRHSWPVYVRDGLADYLPWSGGEPQALLRYYLGWYMVPGVAGRLFGPAALNWAVPLWSGAGIALVLLLFARGFGGRRAVFAALVFVLFGGMDVLRILVMRGAQQFQFELDTLGWPGIHVHYNELFGFRGLFTLYLSNFETFRYTPNIIPAALCALLILHLRHHRVFVATSGVVLAAASFWAPFVALGLLPFVAVVVGENAMRPDGRAALAGWRNLCVAAPLAGLFALYLSAGALDFPHGWLWEGYDWRQLAGWAKRFYLSEFLVLLGLLLLLRPRFARDPLFVAMAATLLLLPLYRLGYENLTMRGAMPSLVLLCWFSVRALLQAGAQARGESRLARALRRFGLVGVGCCLAAGSAGALLHALVATRDDATFRYALSGFTTFASVGQPKENLAPEVPLVLAQMLREPVVDAPIPEAPVFRARFNVHVRDRTLFVVRERCDRNDRLIRARFEPANQDTNARLAWGAAPRWYSGGCGAMIGLPGWSIASVRVGQTPPDGGDWAVEILLDEAGDAVGLSQPPACSFQPGAWHVAANRSRCGANPGIAALRAAYLRTRSAAPVARSRFELYVGEKRLTYVREPCVFDDIRMRFFLHATPANPADLPSERGFDNRDFAFGERGGLFDGKCVAVWRIPYRLKELRTGQFSAAGPAWSVTYRRAERRGEGQ